jgi:hypothetical protein
VPDSQPSLARPLDISASEVDQVPSVDVLTTAFAACAARPRRIIHTGTSLSDRSDSGGLAAASSSRAIHSTVVKCLEYRTGSFKEGESWNCIAAPLPPATHKRPWAPSTALPVSTSRGRKRRAASDGPGISPHTLQTTQTQC